MLTRAVIVLLAVILAPADQVLAQAPANSSPFTIAIALAPREFPPSGITTAKLIFTNRSAVAATIPAQMVVKAEVKVSVPAKPTEQGTAFEIPRTLLAHCPQQLAPGHSWSCFFPLFIDFGAADLLFPSPGRYEVRLKCAIPGRPQGPISDVAVVGVTSAPDATKGPFPFGESASFAFALMADDSEWLSDGDRLNRIAEAIASAARQVPQQAKPFRQWTDYIVAQRHFYSFRRRWPASKLEGARSGDIATDEDYRKAYLLLQQHDTVTSGFLKERMLFQFVLLCAAARDYSSAVACADAYLAHHPFAPTTCRRKLKRLLPGWREHL